MVHMEFLEIQLVMEWINMPMIVEYDVCNSGVFHQLRHSTIED